MERVLSIVIAAIYGFSGSRGTMRRSNALELLRCLRSKLGLDQDSFTASTPDACLEGDVFDEILRIMRAHHFEREALLLDNLLSLKAADRAVARGEVLTIACPGYPPQLRRLGSAAPAIIWLSSPDLVDTAPWFDNEGAPRLAFAGVGCREPLTFGLACAREAGVWVATMTALAISGGAQGCDTAFAQGALGAGGEVVHILPTGLNLARYPIDGYAISLDPPDTPFSIARAMQRNALIHAFGEMSIVCSVRYRHGGTWQGTTDALRQKRSIAILDWSDISPKRSSNVDSVAGRVRLQPKTFEIITDETAAFKSSHGLLTIIGDEEDGHSGPTVSGTRRESQLGSLGGALHEAPEGALGTGDGTYANAQKALRNLGAYPVQVIPSMLRGSIFDGLAEAYQYALDQQSGRLDVGLFAS